MKSKFSFAIIAMYIDKKKFFHLQIKQLSNEILVHQFIYTKKKKVLKHFYMYKANPLNSLSIVQSLNIKNDHFHILEDNEGLLVLKYHISIQLVH